MSAAKEVDVEQQLRLAAATAAWPTTPDLQSGVLARIGALQADDQFMKAYMNKQAPGHADAVARMLRLHEHLVPQQDAA